MFRLIELSGLGINYKINKLLGDKKYLWIWDFYVLFVKFILVSVFLVLLFWN